MTVHPALSLLLTVGLLQFWILPAFAWAMLRDQRDTAANFWFAGTACYALAATLVALQTVAPSAMGAMLSVVLVVLLVALLAESLRRELHTGPTPWRAIVVLVVVNVAGMVTVQRVAGTDTMRAVQLAVISLLDIGCCVLLWRVIRRHRSRALLFVLLGFVAVIATNVGRIVAYWTDGESTALLTFTLESNLGFIANYLSVILYSFGYWGFVIEKNRARLTGEISERTRAQESETQALERERLMQELLRQRDELITQLAQMQRAAQAGALSASIAHEINQPLGAVRLSAEEAIARLQAGGGSDDLQPLLKRIADENQRAATIIRTLREIFRGQTAEAETRSVDELVQQVCGLLRRRAHQLGVRIHVDLQAPVIVRVGAGEIEHVLLNLLGNALDALSRTAVSAPTVTVRSRADASQVQLQVQDNGPGVAPDMRERLFDLFAGSSAGGLGLGLWLSRYIVERHGGQLQLDPPGSQPGAGFTLTLPRALPRGRVTDHAAGSASGLCDRQ